MRSPTSHRPRRGWFDGVRLLGLAAVLVLAGLGRAHAERRVALVIGESNYAQVPSLPNPVRDADVMSSLFTKAGFDAVVNRRDIGIGELRRTIREFSALAADADVAVVYYAGHGMEIDGANYLVPTDAKLISDFDVEDETMSLDRILKSLDATKRLKLVILDACRDNPFARAMKRSVATRSVGRGLAKVEPTMSDTLVAFAAKAGAVAADGDGSNSPFALALVRHITEPGLDLRIAFGRVRDDVLQSTGSRQEPFVYGSLGGSTMSLVPPPLPTSDPNAAARIDFELAAQIGTRLAWDAFLANHPTGLYADMARVQNRRLTDAEDGRMKAEAARREAERLAAEKSDEVRRQVEERAAKQAEEARRRLSDQAKRDLEDARRQIAEQTQRELDEARQKVELAQREAEAARLEVEAAKRDAAADAQKRAKDDAARAAADAKLEKERVASLTPPQLAPTPSPAAPTAPLQMDPADIARLLQAHLKRVGCDPGNIDGTWTDKSRKALDDFKSKTDAKFETKLASLDALDAVRGRTDRVCPLQCASGQRADGDRCIQISCQKGYSLSGGSCKRDPETARRPQTTAQREPSKPAARSSGGGGKCFAFGGKTYCE